MHRKTVSATRARRLLVAVMVLIVGTAVAALPTATAADPPGQLVQLQLLGFNDYHGYLETDSNPGPGNVGNDAAGGGEYLSAKLRELR